MKNYWKIALMSLLLCGIVSCDKKEPYEPYVVEYEELLSVNLGKVWEAEPEFPDNIGYFYVNVVFPNQYYDTFETFGGTLRVHNYGEKKLWIGTGTGSDKETTSIHPKDMYPGDGIDPEADSHYYDRLSFPCREGTYDVRMEYSYYTLRHWCTPKFRVTIGKDSQGLWTAALQVLEE